ncbi:MAG: ribulose-phosphate 3-epimerase [Candidatus Omnitrophota bacterium]
MKIKIAPSILSADFASLAEEIKKVELAGADMLHIDVMDGHFVPNITIGPVVVKDIRRASRLPLDTHLMIERPQDYVDAFIKAGSDMITLHIETVSEREVRKQSRILKRRGIRPGVSLNPRTPLNRIKGVLSAVDFVLVMSVNPGFGGQDFMPAALPKIRQLRSIFDGDIAVDGGINQKTAKEVLAAGANVLAAGSYIFKSKDYREAIRRLRCPV